MDIHYTDALKLRRPETFQVIVKPSGPACNLNCSYCYYLGKKNLFPGHKNFKLEEELLEDFTRQYIEAQQVPEVTFNWQGGEPTLIDLDYFRKAIGLQKKYSGGKKIENAFQTNGTRLNDDWCSFFAENDILVGVSIDGAEHNHDHYRRTMSGKGTFRRVMKGIELLHKHKVRFNTLSAVNDYNVNFAMETYRFLKQVGSGFMQFLPVAEMVTETEEDNEHRIVLPFGDQDARIASWSVDPADFGRFLITIFNEWVRNDVARFFVQIFDATLANWIGESPGVCVFDETCGDAMVMEHNGNLYLCDHFVFPEYFLGNISEVPLVDIVKSRLRFNFGISKRNSLPGYCLKCGVRYLCNGECPVHRFVSTPDGQPGMNYLCAGYKMFFTHTEPFMRYMANELRNKRSPANVMNWIKNRENQIIRSAVPGRNDPCPCGSGKKFKTCCAGRI